MWQILSLMVNNEVLLASPVETLKALVRLLLEEDFTVVLLTSSLKLSLGFVLGLLAGGLLGCLGAKIETFDKKYTIFAEGSPARHIGILLSGSAQIVQVDYYGNRSILANIAPSEVFAESFACAEVPSLPVSVIANEPSEIMLIDSSTSIGYPLLKAWLEEKGVWKIDYLVMSHNQSDHAGGINAGLIFDFEIGMLYHNGTKNDILFTALDNDIPFTEMKLHDELKIGTGDSLVTVKCMWPDQDQRKNSNAAIGKQNASLVLRFDFGEHSSLFPGDICKTYVGSFDHQEEKKEYHLADTEGAEEKMAAMYQNGELDVDLLKLSSHGNPNTANGHALFKATTPELCVATGFYPLDTGYILAYEKRGYTGDTLFDRKHGFIHITATNDGTMVSETSRDDYKEPYGEKWNTEIGG